MKKYKTIEINGGIGRVLCAEPAIVALSAIEKIKIVTPWPEVFTNNPNIERVYHINANYLFEDVIKKGTFSCPEPYHDHLYYTQQRHLTKTFGDLLGVTSEDKPKIYLTDEEIKNAAEILHSVLDGRPLIAFQPFGSGAVSNNWGIKDSSYRSLQSDAAISIIDSLPDYIFVNFSHIKCDKPNVFNLDVSLRQYFAIASLCHFVVTVDSLLAHVGFAFGKPGIQILGSTFKENIGYPEHYKTYQRVGYPRSYNPNRIHGWTEKNQEAMVFPKTTVDEIIQDIKNFFISEQK